MIAALSARKSTDLHISLNARTPKEAAMAIDWQRRCREIMDAARLALDDMEVLNGITEGLFGRVQAARTRLAAVPDDADPALVALRDEVLALLAEAEDEPPTKGDPDGQTR